MSNCIIHFLHGEGETYCTREIMLEDSSKSLLAHCINI